MKKKGKGMSLVLHPTGNKGAGDAGQAAIELKPDGTFTLIIGTVDLGQGSTTILRQYAADELDVPIESIAVNNSAGNMAPVSWGQLCQPRDPDRSPRGQAGRRGSEKEDLPMGGRTF